jgi:hypothetical protein
MFLITSECKQFLMYIHFFKKCSPVFLIEMFYLGRNLVPYEVSKLRTLILWILISKAR